MGSHLYPLANQLPVVPLPGHVDRNEAVPAALEGIGAVVPLPGHVDRNIVQRVLVYRPLAVVPLPGHVDRNVGEIPDWAADTGRAPPGARG